MSFNYDDKLYYKAFLSTMRDFKSTLMEYAIDNNFAYKGEARGMTYIV